MNIVEATASYEKWLAQHLTLLPHDLELKHDAMAASVFPFLRATFYRFAQLWKTKAGDAAGGPKVLAIGDLHVANFGTWRDIEGRLIWGINDFDEVYPMPYTIDLVRLAVSAHIAADENHLAIAAADACDSILTGYKQGIECGGRPFVLAEDHAWLRNTVTGDLRNPVDFWKKLNEMKDSDVPVPKAAQRGIDKLLPKSAFTERVAHRVAGLGSLGRERYVALARLDGAQIAREAKALCASACVWAGYRGGASTTMYESALNQSVRAIDPLVRIKKDWIVRRLAPYCSRVDLASLPKQREESRLLRAMGFELANVHVGTAGAAKKVIADLNARPKKWLHKAALSMKTATEKDFQDWTKASGKAT